jgi:ribosome-binding factor A
MQYPQLKSPTKAQIDAANSHKQEKAIRADIHKIDAALQSTDVDEVLAAHRYLDGKYQCCITDWGKSMWGYGAELGFAYDMLGIDSLKENLTMMKPKLEAFIHGWNTTKQSSRYTPISAPDVNVTVNNNVTVNVTFEQVRAKIEYMTSLTDEQTREALEKVSEIESVVKGEGSKKSKWEKIKPILVWLADKSFDVAMTILPLLLQVQS